MQCLIDSSCLDLVTTNRGLINSFTNKVASPEQTNDLLSFREIGLNDFLLRIQSCILKLPSVNAPNRKKKLQTFSVRKINKKKVTKLEKDRKLIISAMRKKIKQSQITGHPIDQPFEQLIPLPLAICDSDGNPLKGQKSCITKFYESRYKNYNNSTLGSTMHIARGNAHY